MKMTMCFEDVVSKMVKMLVKAGRNIGAMKIQENPEIKKIYLKKAQDRYDGYEMWSNVLPSVAKEEFGGEFSTDNKIFMVLEGVFKDWAMKVKEDIEKAKATMM